MLLLFNSIANKIYKTRKMEVMKNLEKSSTDIATYMKAIGSLAFKFDDRIQYESQSKPSDPVK